jgi:Tol biopolymer transport system component
MKTKIKSLLGAGLSLLVTFGFTHNATAQSNGRILFTAPATIPKTHETYDQVFSMNSDGSGVRQLTGARASCLYPAWSPGRAYIAFQRNSTIYVMEAIGEANGGRTFTVGPSMGSGLDWSPDGQSLVFVGPGVINTYGIWIVDVDPATGAVGTPMMVVDDGGYYTPCFSPDGSRIAYVAPGGCGTLIKVFDLTTREVLFSIGAAPCTTPSWSPDGNYLAFSSVAAVTITKGRKTTTQNCYEIFIANADGSGITQVTSIANPLNVFPKWSDDGHEIAFRSAGGDTSSIYRVTLATGVVTSLCEGYTLDWTP